MHTCTSVISKFIENKTDKSLWVKYPKTKITDKTPIAYHKMGLYIFGGCNEYGEPMNDLWYIRPNHKKNS